MGAMPATHRVRVTPLALLLAFAALLTQPACGGPVRVELEPGSVQLFGAGQGAAVHATPREKSGKAAPAEACRWTLSDPAIASLAVKHNDATVTALKAGSAVLACAVGGVKAEIPVSVRTVARLEVAPAEVALELADEPRPLALTVKVLDDQGSPVPGRIVLTRCEDEAVCRGDARGQLWATGQGRTRAVVEAQGATATVAVTVKDVRTELTRPKVIQRGYMEDLERQVQRKQAAEAGR